MAWYAKPAVIENGTKKIGSYREENAKLIAAAPELLKALQKLLKSTYPNYKTVDDSAHPANLALKAINKALK